MRKFITHMSNRFIKNYLIICVLLISAGGICLYNTLPLKTNPIERDPRVWEPPSFSSINNLKSADLIFYGKELILHTAAYFGPHGKISHTSNGMNCGNCHLQGGTRYNGNNFGAVASTYPKFRERSGKVENLEFRINDCFERSLNGSAIDTNGKEMKAMVCYILWLGGNVPRGIKPLGSAAPEIPVLERAASPATGGNIYTSTCQICHGSNGEGKWKEDSTGYIYPPLWGENSYNVSAGMFRISRLAGFIKNNMPYTTVYSPPKLSDQEAWDVASFICSQKRPEKHFKSDWPRLSAKPFDYPFGPYVDSFSSMRHKYGPFAEIISELRSKK